jgi:hypothetical protein
MANGALGGAIYGAARALQDTRRSDMEEEGFRKDQELRDERLSQERELRPLRMRATEQGVEEGEKRLQLTDLNIDIARMTKEQRAKAQKDLDESQDREKVLKIGLGQFHASGEPQMVADALAKINPEQSQLQPDGKHGLKAVRTDAGSIILTGPDGNERVLKGGKTKDGRAYTPDEELAMMAYKILNPLEVTKKRLETDFAIEKEQVKADAAADRARIAAESREAVATTRATSSRAIADDRGIRLGKSFVDAQLKTTSIPGHFANVYSSEDDAKLRRFMDVRMGELVRSGTEPEKAASQAIEEIRNKFATSKKEALDAGEALNKAKVNPKDAEAVSRAAKAGNKAAQAYMQIIGRIRREMGDDAARYLFEQTPGARK